jgi:hypothetical protein
LKLPCSSSIGSTWSSPAIGLVAVPVLYDAFGLAALDEELERLLDPVVYDTVKAHGEEPIPR